MLFCFWCTSEFSGRTLQLNGWYTVPLSHWLLHYEDPVSFYVQSEAQPVIAVVDDARVFDGL